MPNSTSRFRTITMVIALSMVALAGVSCTSEAAGKPNPRTSTASKSPNTTPPSDETRSREVPRVENPLDASRFHSRPCDVLTQEQLASFGVTRPGEPVTTGAVAKHGGPFCTWLPESLGNIGIGFLIGHENGLADTYSGREQIESFIPTTVSDYPAVFANDPDLRDSGRCVIIVALSDTSVFQAMEHGSLDAEGSCARVKQVAAAALVTIRGGG